MSDRGLAAVLWDMDGTLVDSERLWTVTMGELAEHLGGDLAPEVREELTGSSLRRTVTTVRRSLGLDGGPGGTDAERDEAAVERDARWLLERTTALFARGLPWLPGAREALAAVRATGVATALVTSTYREVTEVALDTIGREWFDVTVCGDEVGATKPDPAPYLRAAALLGVDPARCVAVEDSATGSGSALAAGATVLLVGAGAPGGPVGAGADASGARRWTRRASLADLRVDELDGLLAGAPA